MNLFNKLAQEIVVCDGGMGTMLQAAGLPPGTPPEIWNLSSPDKIKAIHKAYIGAGAQIITTNTFGGNRIKLKEYGLEKDIQTINQKAIEIARSASNESTIVAASIGPTGKFLKPFGELTFTEAYEIFKEQASYLTHADVIMIETMIDSLELKAAVIGARDAILSKVGVDSEMFPLPLKKENLSYRGSRVFKGGGVFPLPLKKEN
ncbi:MAG: homocysteine S-methyltransferase family protein, partial [Candidatus Stahlbacteria bacterium]|nr:homocysteine S-methyltransferase family protein [Candidatus Stahlbacteria bacterium]